MNYFDHYSCPQDYLDAGVESIEPMTAKEVMEKDLQEVYSSDDYIVERKLDGVRGILQFMPKSDEVPYSHIRVFSRRVSVKTNFYGEKSDSLPHIRDISIPELDGTILDCEMVVRRKDFKTVSSILNCLPEEALERQRDCGKVTCRVFDCICFKGEDVSERPLRERKKLLGKVFDVIREHGCDEYLAQLPYHQTEVVLHVSAIKAHRLLGKNLPEPLATSLPILLKGQKFIAELSLTREEYFQYIVATGGEGIMVKNLDSIYEQKRTRAFQKIKKRVYRDVVILGYTEPTKDYEGKFPNNKWTYWESMMKLVPTGKTSGVPADSLCARGYHPVTKNYYYGKIGGIKFGVRVSKEDMSNLQSSKKRKQFEFIEFGGNEYVIVGECEGISDDLRDDISKRRKDYLGKVFEVEGNEMFYDTGKIRHPRFYRWREDKDAKDCWWKDHINA